MPTRRAEQEHKVVVTIPDIGLKQSEINALKKSFKNEIVTRMGGAEALARRRIVVVIVVVVVTGGGTTSGW